MSEKVYVKEIPAFKLHVVNTDGAISYKEEMYNLLLPHLSPKFRNQSDNNVAVACFPPFPYDSYVEETISNYINSNIKNSDTNIFFDNVYEGHVLSCIVGIHRIAKKINLNLSKCYFISGGMQAYELYNQYCESNNITEKINIIVLNSWERHVFRTTIDNKSILEPKFEIKNKDKLFLCFNRIFRSHRAFLLSLLYQKNLVSKSYYSFFSKVTYGESPSSLPDFKYLISDKTFNIIETEFNKHQSEFPLLLNNSTGENTNRILKDDFKFYDNSYFSVVTETFFFRQVTPSYEWEEESVFFSEKIFKPIICKHPFIIVSRPKSLHFLKKIGYKTFHPYIDESYDDIENDEERLLTIVNEIDRLSKKTPEEWIKFLSDVKNTVEFNYQLMMNKSNDDFQYFDDSVKQI